MNINIVFFSWPKEYLDIVMRSGCSIPHTREYSDEENPHTPRQWVFLFVTVSFPILGTDVLKHHLLVVDVVNLRSSSLPHWA